MPKITVRASFTSYIDINVEYNDGDTADTIISKAKRMFYYAAETNDYRDISQTQSDVKWPKTL